LQQRGVRRVEAILDAAAAILVEDGIGALTMHGIARRSGTTIGSMYHFFTDVASVLTALSARHAQGLMTLIESVDAANVRWARISAAVAVDRFLHPLLRYVRAHPDLLPILRHVRAPQSDPDRLQLLAILTSLIERIVAARKPALSSAARKARAATIIAIIDGVAQRSALTISPSRGVMTSELKRALVAYLNAGGE
jgi:AcrR family transcriptional regulator